MSRRLTQTITTSSVAAGATLHLNQDIQSTGFALPAPSAVNILKLKVVPSIIGDGNTTAVRMYHTAARATGDRFLTTDAFPNSLFQPMDDSSGTPAETAYSTPIAADDDDATGKWHFDIDNLSLTAKTYTITIDYEEIQNTDTAGNVTFRGGAAFPNAIGGGGSAAFGIGCVPVNTIALEVVSGNPFIASFTSNTWGSIGFVDGAGPTARGSIAFGAIAFGGADSDFGLASLGAVKFSTAGVTAVTIDAAAQRLIVESGKLRIASIPTSAAGLSAGDVWSNAGVLTIV